MKNYRCTVSCANFLVYQTVITASDMESAMESVKAKYNIITISHIGFIRNVLPDGRFVSISVTLSKY